VTNDTYDSHPVTQMQQIAYRFGQMAAADHLLGDIEGERWCRQQLTFLYRSISNPTYYFECGFRDYLHSTDNKLLSVEKTY